MVEIALAIVIIAIGLSSVLVLFPIGINATRAAVEESLAPEVSECIVHYIRSSFLNVWKNKTDASDSDFADFLSNGFESIKDVTQQDVESLTETVANFPELKEGSKKGLYKFTKTNADGESFTTLVKVWKPNDSTNPVKKDLLHEGDSFCPLFIPDVYNLPENENPQAAAEDIRYDDGSGKDPSERPKLTEGNLFSKFAQSVLVEISWPVESPEDERNKRTFRVDVYNPYHKIQIAP